MKDRDKAQAVGHIPSGLFVVCSNTESSKEGYLASWVQQISFSPLMIAVACKKGRAGYEHISSGKVFTLNVVGEHKTNYMKYFWSGYAPEDNPFAELDHKISENSGIILTDAKSCMECKMVSKSEPGDHVIIFAEVIASHILDEQAKVKTHVRKSGLDY